MFSFLSPGRRVVALAAWKLKTSLHLRLRIPPATSQVDSELSTALFGLPLHMRKRLGWEYAGGGWKIGRVCINPPNNLAVEILISLSPLPFPTLPLNPEDRSGAVMSGEVGKSGRKNRDHTGAPKLDCNLACPSHAGSSSRWEARERDKSLVSDCTDLFLVGREAVDLQDLPASGMK